MKLTYRPRRARANSFSRRMMQENTLTCNDLIYPIFIHHSSKIDAIKTMPNIYRHSIQSLLDQAAKAVDLNIPAIALFPSIEPHLKTSLADEAFNPKGLIPSAIKKIKSKFPNLGVIADVALDPYTSHGHDGLMNDKGEVDNDKTVKALAKQALILADAGADIIAPSDMMDGRIRVIRDSLEKNGHLSCLIMSYAAKYASHFYGPFRDAVGSKSKKSKRGVNKSTYQMDFHNSDEALNEVELDLIEGADWLLIKPGISYLDILKEVKQEFKKPTFSYQVSGEYAMLQFAAINHAIDYQKVLIECLVSFKRAGADGIFTYCALDAAKILNQ